MWSSLWSNKLPVLLIVVQLAAGAAVAQEPAPPATMQTILNRLDSLENQNQMLLEEIRSLRQEIKSQPPPASEQPGAEITDRVTVLENRIGEQAQTKVGASQRFPVSLTGMILFDSYLIHGNENSDYQPASGNYDEWSPGGGATLRQSIIGFAFDGPQIAFGGRINAAISMDFAAASNNNDVLRIRNGDISFDWSARSITVGQDKTIIAPYAPTSFARVSTPPLAGAGNLWLWRPQMKYEERHALSSSTGLVFQAALYSTDENYASNPPVQAYIANTRPALQARAAVSHTWTDQTRFAVGVGGHESESHINGISIPSRVLSSDFLFQPLQWLQVTGTVLHGENFANLGGLPPGVAVAGTSLIAVKGTAGWMQIALPVTKRLTFDAYAGRQVNASLDLTSYQIAGSLVYAGNVLYRFGPNVVLGFEGAHQEFAYANHSLVVANRYDATLAYLF